MTGPSRTTTTINPATGEAMEEFAYLDAAGREAALARAQAGFEAWRELDVTARGDVLRRVGAYFRDHADDFACTITCEMGKPIKQAAAEVTKCADLCDWYAEHGPALIADEPTEIAGEKAYVSFLPLGVVFAVMPWNFPLWQVMRGAVPIMLAGNGFLLKHSANVLRCAHNIADAFAAAGAPERAFSLFTIEHDAMPATVADKRVAAVTLTGSVRAGAAVAAEAGRNIKKSVLELGGSDPFIVLADADLDAAVAAAVQARFQNTGQICIAAKRIIVEEAVADDFTARFVEQVKALKLGDPADEATYVGPMARRDLRDELDRQVAETVAEGATLVMGGHAAGDEAGNWYAPTVLTGVKPGMTAFRDETFGPVAAIIVAADAEAAVALANDSDYGLSGAIWSADEALAQRLARRLETGGVFINGFAASDPRTPIGGVKHSGYGRELSHFGIREFTNAQVVWKDRR